MAEWMFDARGQAALIYDQDCFRNTAGHVVGWLGNNGQTYDLNGAHVGWFDSGALFDLENRVLGFTYYAQAQLPGRPQVMGAPQLPGFAQKPQRAFFMPAHGRHGGMAAMWSVHDLASYMR